jgi:hypothetical protein
MALSPSIPARRVPVEGVAVSFPAEPPFTSPNVRRLAVRWLPVHYRCTVQIPSRSSKFLIR